MVGFDISNVHFMLLPWQGEISGNQKNPWVGRGVVYFSRGGGRLATGLLCAGAGTSTVANRRLKLYLEISDPMLIT